MKRKEKLFIKLGELISKKSFLNPLKTIIKSTYYGINGHEYSYFSDRNGEHELMEYILSNLKETNLIIFDGGCNRGDFTEDLLEFINKLKIENFEIHLFDIDEEMIKKCESRFKKFKNIKINFFGLSDTNRDEEAIFYPDDPTRNSLKGTALEIGWDYFKKKVKLISGDFYCKKNKLKKIDFLKLDLEGFDFEALKGFSDMFIEKRINFVQFEYTFRALDRRILLRDLFEFFSHFDYEMGFVRKSGIQPIKKFDSRMNDWTLGPNFYAKPK